MTPYRRKAHYYETDQMKIIHHSNYIRWFEEARIDFMDQIGFSFYRVEEEGIIVPVLQVQCDYKAMVRFGDEVRIAVSVSSYNGVKLVLSYTITHCETGQLMTTGSTSHCFLNESGRPVSLKRVNPVLHALFMEALNQSSESVQ